MLRPDAQQQQGSSKFQVLCDVTVYSWQIVLFETSIPFHQAFLALIEHGMFFHI